MKIQSLRPPRSISHRRYLVRLDLNVPVQKGKVQNDYKLIAALPTIRSLAKAPLIIMSHLGEPLVTGKRWQFKPSYSLQPIADYLQKHLKRRVILAKGSWSTLCTKSRSLKPGEIMLLENIRFWPGETKNDLSFAKQLAQLGDIYVNDAFAVSHRAHASVSAITHFLPTYAGPALLAEVKHLRTILEHRAITVVLGGAKISTKLPLISNLLPRARYILIGGAMANNLLRSRGYEIGASIADKNEIRLAKKLTAKKIIIPSDVIVKRVGKYCTLPLKKVMSKDVIVDIGPETADCYADYITPSKTIIWNGPMGIYENPQSRQGTATVIKAINKATYRGAFSLVGGGETISALEMIARKKNISWVSTGGGATLMFLSGATLPGLKSLMTS